MTQHDLSLWLKSAWTQPANINKINDKSLSFAVNYTWKAKQKFLADRVSGGETVKVLGN